MISKKTINHLIKLANLRLARKGAKKLQKDLIATLQYVKRLEEIDIEGVLPASHPMKTENVLRRDEPSKKEIKEITELIRMAPEKKNGYFKTKRILSF